MKKILFTIIILSSFIQVLYAQVPYNPFTQNIHYVPEPGLQGFSCGSSPEVAFTQGIITADSALLFSTQPLKVKILISGFVFLPSVLPTNLVSGSYASNFDWSFDPLNSNCLVGVQNQALPGTGFDPLNINLNSSGTIQAKLYVPTTLVTTTVLSVNVTLEIPAYMQATNNIVDDVESSITQSYCTATSFCDEAPSLNILPDNKFCFGDNVQLNAHGENGANFEWVRPANCNGIITTDTNGFSNLLINNFQNECNGTFLVRQMKNGCSTWSNYDTINLNSGIRPNIQFVTTNCVNNTGQVQVNATTPIGVLEFSINGGSYQNNAILNTSPGSAFYVSVRQQGTTCIATYEGRCVHCTNINLCSNPPKDSIVSPKLVCPDLPINLSGYFTNSSLANWSSSGSGTFNNSTITTSGSTVSYTLSNADIATGYVNITLTTNDPDGNGPCVPGICVRHIRIINGLVAPLLSSNTPVCSGSSLQLNATGSMGQILWTGPNSYSSLTNPTIINNINLAQAGIYSATFSAYGCNSVSNQNVVTVLNPLNLNIAVNKTDEICANQSNGIIEVAVSNGSGNYTTCFNNFSNCSNNAFTTFSNLASSNYTITVVDNSCPSNIHSTPVTINSGTIVLPPVIPNSFSICQGETLNLIGNVAPGHNIEWRKLDNTYVSTGVSVYIQDANSLIEGNYQAIATSPNGCGSTPVFFTVVLNSKPIITSINVNCNSNVSEVLISAIGNTLSYSVNGTNFQSSNLFSGLLAGNYTISVSDGTCVSTQSISVQNCLCPNEPTINITNPLVSCGLTPIPLTAIFSNVLSATWSSNGFGIFSIVSGSSPISNTYTPSISDLLNGYVNLTLTTDDPDGIGPCVPKSEMIHIVLLDSLQVPQAIGPFTYCQGDTTSITSNSTLPILHWYDFGSFSTFNYTMIIPNVNMFKSGFYVAEAFGNGCISKLDTFELIVNNMPSLNITKTITNESCFGNANGAIDFNISGGSGNYKICYNTPASCFTGGNNINLKWLTPGIYNLTITDLSCPNASILQTETILAGPIVSPPFFATSNSPICEGQNLILSTDGNGGEYKWIDKNNNFIGNGKTLTRSPSTIGMSGVYEVKRVVDGCASVGVSTEVSVFDYPTINSIDTLCNGGEENGTLIINSLSQNNMVYSINNNGFQNSNEFNGLTNGLYLVQVRSQGSNCSIAENVELYCECYCNKDAKFGISPNPNTGQFNINIELYETVDDIIYMNLMDISGKIIYKKENTIKGLHFEDKLDIKGLATGSYFLKINFGDVENVQIVNIN